MAERCAYHSTSKRAQRRILPKASDTTPSEKTLHIIHDRGSGPGSKQKPFPCNNAQALLVLVANNRTPVCVRCVRYTGNPNAFAASFSVCWDGERGSGLVARPEVSEHRLRAATGNSPARHIQHLSWLNSPRRTAGWQFRGWQYSNTPSRHGHRPLTRVRNSRCTRNFSFQQSAIGAFCVFEPLFGAGSPTELAVLAGTPGRGRTTNKQSWVRTNRRGCFAFAA